MLLPAVQVLQEDIGFLSSLCPALQEESSAMWDRVVPSLLFLGQCCQGMLPGTPASILSTSRHCPTRGTQEPSCTFGAGVALTVRGCNHHPTKDRDMQCRAQKEEIKCSIESVWVFWLKKSKCWSVEVNTQSAWWMYYLLAGWAAGNTKADNGWDSRPRGWAHPAP